MTDRREEQNIHVPTGYMVHYCEDRGYDSPARYYEASFKKWSRSFGTVEEAAAACWGHNDGVVLALDILREKIGV